MTRRLNEQMSLFWHEDQRKGHARILWLKAWLEAINAGRAFTWLSY